MNTHSIHNFVPSPTLANRLAPLWHAPGVANLPVDDNDLIGMHTCAQVILYMHM